MSKCMYFDTPLLRIYLKRFLAMTIDFFIEIMGGVLGGYFGAMMAALVIVLNDVSPSATQKAIWTGMVFGFIFWGLSVSWVNRVLIQGFSRSTIGKKLMDLEIVSMGAPMSWKSMMKNWLGFTALGGIKVVSSLDRSEAAQIHSILEKSKIAQDADDKKAA